MKKILKFLIPVLLILLIIVCVFIFNSNNELKTVSSQNKLNRLYGTTNHYDTPLHLRILSLPWSIFNYLDWNRPVLLEQSISKGFASSFTADLGDLTESASTDSISNPAFSGSNTKKDYSTTNIQVENVDEADINKTDGDYIYSISENDVIITDVRKPDDIKIVAKIPPSSVPEDLILYGNKLAIISESSSYPDYSTYVDIYNIEDKTNPTKIKGYQLLEPYYTSRCINNRLYVISSGRLRKENNDVISYYYEDNAKKDINLNTMHYLKDVATNVQTIISTVDLDNPTNDIGLQTNLIDISNAYVSEHNIYLLNSDYNSDTHVPIHKLFSWRGVIASVSNIYDSDYYYSDSPMTNIYKFNINSDGTVKYLTKTKVEGRTINQFSLDEYNENLRIALTGSDGSRIVILDKNLKKIGESDYLAKGEKMYSSRFIGNKAYLVTYKTVDPLYVIDLSEPTSPKVLGELKIPGYSTYLHPYDENHLIGIGMETKENIRKNSSGKVISTTASIVGMKMALFDISNVNKPIQISGIVIGDNRTTSNILTNHKALLFSKEKELLAIPVNNYPEDFEISTSTDSYSNMINSYNNYRKPYTSEGYLVYKINLKEGITLRGKIIHELQTSRYSYSTNSRLLRGLYIDNNIFTISEDTIKVNNLETLEDIDELKIKNENESKNTQNISNSPSIFENIELAY